MKVLGIIQARANSTRFPNKVLKDLEGKTVLERVVERVKKSALVSDVVVATTINKEDLKIAGLCSGSGIRVFRGSENDVLDRFYQAAELFKPEHVLRITADCPLIDPAVIDKVVAYHLSQKCDYTGNTLQKETYPDGEDTEVFTFNALKRSWEEASLASEREHVTPYMKKNPDKFKCANVKCEKDLSKKRWTLDNPEDYEFIKTIYRALYHKNPFFGMEEVLDYLKAHPELEKVNSHIIKNEGYIKSLSADRRVHIEGREKV